MCETVKLRGTFWLEMLIKFCNPLENIHLHSLTTFKGESSENIVYLFIFHLLLPVKKINMHKKFLLGILLDNTSEKRNAL